MKFTKTTFEGLDLIGKDWFRWSSHYIIRVGVGQDCDNLCTCCSSSSWILLRLGLLYFVQL